MKNLVVFALDEAQRLGADYVDVRFRDTQEEVIYTHNDVLRHVHNDKECGIGIRVLCNGRWGFAATPILQKDAVAQAAQQAVAIAKAASIVAQKPIQLVPAQTLTSQFKTPIQKDPFQVPLKDKIELLFAIYEKAQKVDAIKRVNGNLHFRRMHQLFVSSEGSDLENEVFTSSASYTLTAVKNHDFQTRMYQEYVKNLGYEWIEQQPLLEKVESLTEEAVQKIAAKPSPQGKKDLILLPSHLMLTIHESVGHPTELDRVLGWEANFAGTSFATTEKLGQFQYGSPIVNFVADNTLESGLATWGFDDDGVPGKKWDIVKDGVLMNYGTTRETAHYIGQQESFGCNRADSYASQPINRIPNLSLMPGKDKLSLQDLIADTEDGILIDGRGSFSIDQRRYNFQFGGDMFYEIKNGKVAGILRDVTYQAITPQFWNSCDAICDASEWQAWGVMNCGKGEPSQRMQMSHGSAPARFRNIDVGGALNG